MRRRAQLIAMTVPYMTVVFISFAGLAFDSADRHVYFGMLLAAIVMLLVGIVSYLHRLLYGEEQADADPS